MRLRGLWLSFIIRVMAAAVAVLAARAWVTAAFPGLSVWVLSPFAFASARIAGDAVALLLFRETLVVFYEDLVWELVAFLLLGLLAAGIIVLVERFIGGPVTPYVPSIVVYGAYALAEVRQAAGRRQD